MHKNYQSNGYEIKKIFEDKTIKDFENTLIFLCKMQLKKLNLNSKSNNIQILVKNLFKKNSSALFECFLMAKNSSAGHNLCGDKNLLKCVQSLLGNKMGNIISGPNLFINVPGSSKKKYTWHSEQNWYPKRRNFLNIWCPIFESRDKNNSMTLKLGSHKKDWFYFSEYQGYDGKYSQDSNVQYEIPNNFLKKYKSFNPKVKRNEALIFNGKIVHRSVNIKSKKILFALNFRVFDYTNDLTLSSNWADIPYNRKSFGVPNIIVE
tara:strand:- start:334 stop:1122 length:789 start_codon:yes stop_codon:yes gene_type:complete